ncbi:MAG: excinuclease ABC subunit UvrA [Planctomycetota bacterium]
MPITEISIRGAREHNLRGVDLDIPRDKLVVITGPSGSGKSSLAFDTVFAEGQRKYMESLSAYARQFLDRMRKPKVERIEGLPPTIAIEQRSASHNPRSTVATTTEVYDYLRLLWARIGSPRCWQVEKGKACGHPLTQQSARMIVDHVLARPDGAKLMICAPVIRGKKGHHKEVFAGLTRQGFVRARVDGEVIDLRDLAETKAKTPFTTQTQRYQKHTIDAVVDRVVIRRGTEEEQDELRQRVADSIELSLKLANGVSVVAEQSDSGEWTDTLFSERHACPIHPECALEDLEPRLFSFNSPSGACPTCKGLGTRFEFDPALVVPNPELPLAEGAVEAWRKSGKRMNILYGRLIRRFCRDFEVSPQTPYKSLPKAVQRILLEGTTDRDETKYGAAFEGVIPNLQRRFDTTDSEFVKHRLSGYLSERPCDACEGARLSPESLHVFLELDPAQAPPGLAELASTTVGKFKRAAQGVVDPPAPETLCFNIADITRMTIEQTALLFDAVELQGESEAIAAPILKEIVARLGFMQSVGLNYLGLNRSTGTLSGGEAQRIRLATQVGSGLVGCCYVLDEPTIGLHQRDNARLIRTLRRLCDIGNTVLVVEHDLDTVRAADYLIDVGPGPGRHGGQIVSQGLVEEVALDPESLTGRYLRRDLEIPVPTERRAVSTKKAMVVKGARANNLRNVDAAFPLGGLILVTGVSGSGKSTLVNQVLLKAAQKAVTGSRVTPGAHTRVTGLGKVDRVIEVDQSPIGRTPRSNPGTYTGVFDLIRALYAKTKEAKLRGYQPGRFSFNVKGGRCEACQGQGLKKIEMHFLPDVFVACDVCGGTRYERETLEVTLRGKNIADVLALTVEEALEFFDSFADIARLLRALCDVGLGYIQLGQASTTLSGGEAQRVKLATELGKRSVGHTLYVLDEPTTGLHMHDVRKLIEVLDRLADAGHTVLLIEHHLDVIKRADWVLDLGPEGGDGGGTLVAQGTPEDIAANPDSYTGTFLREVLEPDAVHA